MDIAFRWFETNGFVGTFYNHRSHQRCLFADDVPDAVDFYLDITDYTQINFIFQSILDPIGFDIGITIHLEGLPGGGNGRTGQYSGCIKNFTSLVPGV